MTAILVTGGAGFIGSHLVDRLLAAGHTVTVVDDFSTGKDGNLAGARVQHGDRLTVHALDLTGSELAAVVAAAKPEVVCHLAAQIDVRASVADPVHDALVNVVGTVTLLEAARKAGIRKVVFTTSGGTIYGEPDPDDLPIDEAYPGHPGSPYGASKRGTEEYLHAFRALYGLRWTSLALANVFGPRQDPHGEAGVVSIFGGRMLRGEPVTIFGDGTQTRDFVYVDDVVDAFVAAIDHGDDLRCNIGTGVETSVMGLYSAIAALAGYDAMPEHAPPRTGELDRIALDCGLAERALGWRPRVALRDGLSATLDWLRS